MVSICNCFKKNLLVEKVLDNNLFCLLERIVDYYIYLGHLLRLMPCLPIVTISSFFSQHKSLITKI